MNAVMKDSSSPISTLFARLLAGTPALATTTAEQRVAKLRKLFEATMAAKPAILKAGYTELRLCEMDVNMQLLMVKTEFEFAARNLAKWMKPATIQPTIMSLGKKSYLQYQPKGMILHVSTWNAPIAEAMVPAFGAIAAGNVFVLKPSELAPHSAQVLADIFAAAGLPDDIAVVQGGAETAQELLSLPFNHIFYIGGHGVGRIVMKAAAEHFATVTLEMGGKNPVIIDKSADLSDAGKKIAWGRVANAGQVCVAPDYALVHQSVERDFVKALGDGMTQMYNAKGEGFAKSAELPRIVNRRHFDRIKGLLDDAIEKGATVELGGETNADDLYVSPTILTGLKPNMRILQDEIFGPILCVLPFASREDAISEISKRPKPLSAYIFAKDREAIDWFTTRTTSGSMVVNHNLIQSGTNPHLPFGGVNASGMGRLGGHSSFLECSNARSVVEDGPGLGDPYMMFPPYSDKYKEAISWMLNKGVNVPDGMLNFIAGVLKMTNSLSGKN